MRGKVKAISISKIRGTKKTNVASAVVKKDYGIIGDAHAGEGKRQVSLLAYEVIDQIRSKGLCVDAGEFAENITTEGINLRQLSVGTRLAIGDSVVIEISQIGKECPTKCAVFYRVGECVMPKEGVFGRVIEGGQLRLGDEIRTLRTAGVS